MEQRARVEASSSALEHCAQPAVLRQLHHEEYEPALDERMIVNSFVSLDRTPLPPGFETSEEYDIAFSRLLYVDQDGEGFRYDAQFIHNEMKRQVYRRWQHEGTLYGMTAYSSVTSTLGRPGMSGAADGVHRMFRSRNLLIAVIALFYRASLLGLRRSPPWYRGNYFPLFSGGRVRHRHIQFATRLMADFHYFNTYWFHLEPTTKDEELEHFSLVERGLPACPDERDDRETRSNRWPALSIGYFRCAIMTQ